MSDLSWLNPTPHAIAVYASQPLSPVAPQHSLPSGRYSLLGPDFHRLDRTSFAWRTHSIPWWTTCRVGKGAGTNRDLAARSAQRRAHACRAAGRSPPRGHGAAPVAEKDRRCDPRLCPPCIRVAVGTCVSLHA